MRKEIVLILAALAAIVATQKESTSKYKFAVFANYSANAALFPKNDFDYTETAYNLYLHFGDVCESKMTDEVKKIYRDQIKEKMLIFIGGKNLPKYLRHLKSTRTFVDSFNRGPVHFLVVDTDVYYPRNEENIRAQEKEIEEDLREANRNRKNVPWVVVLGDRPFLCADAFGECRFDNNTDNKAASYERKELKSLYHLLNTSFVDLGIWARGSRYERFLPVLNRTVYFRHEMTIPDTYVNPPTTVHMTTGSQVGCELVNQTAEWTRSPWSGFATGRGQGWGFIEIEVVNDAELHIKHRVEGKVDDDIKLVKANHTGKFDVGKFKGGMQIPDGFCFNQKQCPKDHLPYFGSLASA